MSRHHSKGKKVVTWKGKMMIMERVNIFLLFSVHHFNDCSHSNRILEPEVGKNIDRVFSTLSTVSGSIKTEALSFEATDYIEIVSYCASECAAMNTKEQ